MKFFRFINKYLVVAALIGCSILSCKKLIEIPPNPPDKIPAELAFSDSANALSVMAGVYYSFGAVDDVNLAMHNGGITAFTGLTADELINQDVDNQENDAPFFTNSLLPRNGNVNALWKSAYTSLYIIHAALEGLDKSDGISASFKKQLIGELKTARAFCYFNLVNVFGAVPLITSTDYVINSRVPRSEADAIYDEIISDLEEARTLLTPEYPTAGHGRPNRLVATALLAKVHLYLNNWEAAATLSGEVIESGNYVLEQDLNNVFLKESPEAIWQLPTDGYVTQTVEGYFFVPYPEYVPRFGLTASLLETFEEDDQRRVSWVAEQVINDESFFYPFKYKNNYICCNPTQEHYMILRLAEQYLIRAEARAESDAYDDALSDLNTVRDRAGLAGLVFSSKENLLADIMQERRVELFAEWGNRWFDLKRRNLADAVLGVAKPNWQPEDKLYPVPQTQRDNNPFLDQNIGY